MGINVHNREEMIQYLNEHGYGSIQEAVKRVMYNFDFLVRYSPIAKPFVDKGFRDM